MNREQVRQAEIEEHKRKSAEAWQDNGFAEDEGAAAMIAKAKASREQYPTPVPKPEVVPGPEVVAAPVPNAAARGRKK